MGSNGRTNGRELIKVKKMNNQMMDGIQAFEDKKSILIIDDDPNY